MALAFSEMAFVAWHDCYNADVTIRLLEGACIFSSSNLNLKKNRIKIKMYLGVNNGFSGRHP